jgi:uncharacterized protein DUF1616
MPLESVSVRNLRSEKPEGPGPRENLLDEQAFSFLKKNGAMVVTQLYDGLRIRNPSLGKAEATDLVWRLVKQGRVEVEDLPPATGSLLEYLGLWERNLWFYASLAVSLLTVLVVFTVPPELPLVILQWVLGSVFVLFIPGYLAVGTLFPKGRELDGVERFALSVGLSMALIPLVVLLLNYTPWGIRLGPIVVSLTILTLGLALTGLGRRFAMSVNRLHSDD